MALPAIALLALVLACSDDADPMGSMDATTPPSDARSMRDDGIDESRPDLAVSETGPDEGPPPVDAGSDAAPTAGAAVACAERSVEIARAAGTIIEVSPAGPGQVNVDGATRSLRQVVSSASTGDTILLADGTYTFPNGGGFTGLYFTTPGITLRSASGDASAVILDSAYQDHGNGSAPITVAAADTVLADFTVQRSIYHLIHLWADGDNALVHNVTMIDGGQQFLKASPGGAARVDDAEISCSRFEMTDEGRDNVWGYGRQGGNTTCYTGGIDAHDSRNWHVHDNVFNGIYCNPDGVQRPAHGMNPDARGGQTYRGGLSEHAIHMWDSEEGTGHLIERNRIYNCARGIGLGFRVDTYGTIIRNNTIFSAFAGGREHDVGISVERAHDTSILNNTIFYASGSAYSSTIEFRFPSTDNVEIRNNLTNQRIRSRDDANAAMSANVTDARSEWFVDAESGDLRLARCDVDSVVEAGDSSSDVSDDIDGLPRTGAMDIGADQCSE
ncbi:MAG: hypothetical protein AAF938_09735 [Myxococcota bacterium]